MRTFLSYLTLGTLAILPSVALPAPQGIAKREPRERLLLSCGEVRTRVRFFLDLHLKYRDFSNEISRRTYQKIFETLDADRLFLTDADIEHYRGLEERIDDLVGQANCAFLDDIRTTFLEKVHERLDSMASLTASFSLARDRVENTTVIRPTWAHDKQDLNARWKRRLQQDAFKLRGQPEAQIRERLLRRYTRLANRHLKSSRDEHYSNFLNSFALSLDPHSGHFLPADQDEFNSRLGTPLDGIGITLSDETDFITIDSLLKGGSAERSGKLRQGDRILAIDNFDGAGAISTSGLDLMRIARMVRGKRGSSVRLVIERPALPPGTESETFTLTLPRESVRLRSITIRSSLVEWRGKRLGVVRLPTFYTDFDCRSKNPNPCLGASSETRREIQALTAARIDGILLDLRDNAGGDLQESLNVTGLFLPQGPVLQAKDRRLAIRVQEDPVSSFLYGGPMLVLQNKNSASASEIVIAALQDYGRAIIAGDSRTFGKGTIQVVQELSSPLSRVREGMIKVTQAKFFSPAGRSTQKKGVEADVVIPSLTETTVETESEKDFSLDWEEIRPAHGFHPLQDLSPILAQIRYLSNQRVESNKALIEIREKTNRMTPETRANLQEALGREREDFDITPATDAQLGEGLEILADSIEISKDKQSWVSAVVKPLR